MTLWQQLEMAFRPYSEALQRLEMAFRPYSEALQQLEVAFRPYAQAIASGLKAYAEYEKAEAAIGETGWLPYHTITVDFINKSEGNAALLGQRIANFYETHWSHIRQDIESRLEEYDISKEAKSAFREALSAHECGLYESVPRTLFPEIDRAFRIHFYGDAAGPVSSQRMLDEFTNQGSLADFMPKTAYGLILFDKLLKHIYRDVDDTNRYLVAQDSVPTRHGAMHGLISYATTKHSINMIIMADYIFQVLTRLNNPSFMRARS